MVCNMNAEWGDGCHYWTVALGGMGSLCDKSLIDPAFDRWFDAYPRVEGDKFDLECDFVFGVLAMPKVGDLGYEVLDCASAPNRLWSQDWQMDAKWDFINRALALRKVCLALMVKNEADGIGRCIKSCEGLIDFACIVA